MPFKFLRGLAFSGALFLQTTAVLAAEEIVFADFEGKDYGGWTVTGEAFGQGPAQGTLPGQMKVSGFLGQGLLNSFYHGDASTGTLTSAEFKVERKFIAFLIGGGGFEHVTCLNLLVEGRPVRSATGPNTQSGGSEELASGFWEVSEFAGKTARLEIVDQATGGWGHINVDQIVFSDRKPAGLVRDATRELVLGNRLLNFPVQTGAKMRRVALLVDGAVVREFDIELANAQPDWWAPLEVSAWRGKTATLRVDKLPEDSRGLTDVDQSDEPKDAAQLYHETLRPQFHFSPQHGWNNDPNGLVFAQGEYHLYFQHNPYGWNWGNMHWGHAVSRDLVHWEELPIALYPRQYGDWAFSGSAVVDRQNTGGWKHGGNDLLVAAYTSTGRGECIVYSNDRGRTWTEYEGNPVVKHQGRDPKLVWHAPSRRWVMALYDEAEKKQWITFYTSPDLKSWEYQSRIEGFFECPDLFELPVDGDAKNTRWVLTAASSEYRVGQFDGQKFIPETPKLPGHRGEGFYAAQTFSDIPDGRRVQIGWGQMPTPGMPFNQMMCFPAVLTLRQTTEGVRLCFTPVKELAKLHAKKFPVKRGPLRPGDNPLEKVTGDCLDLRAEFSPGDAEEVGFDLRGTRVSYDAKKQELVCKKHRVPLPLVEGRVRVQILLDRTSLEIFGNDGAVFMPIRRTLKEEDPPVLTLFAKNGVATIRSLEAHELKSAWKK